MNLLLIDNSNTRTKFAISHGNGELSHIFWMPTREIQPDELTQRLSSLSFDAALIGSVVPKTASLLESTLHASVPVHCLTHASPLELELDYPQPEQIGADRLANAVAAHARYGAPAIVIDLGTAVTFDVISATPAYCGGVIAPGLGAMNSYLSRHTALLPNIELAEPTRAIGRSTQEAMLAGAMIGYRGMIREILHAISKELNQPATIIATGGDASLIARGLEEIKTVDPDLTLHGLEIIARRVFDPSNTI